MFFKYFFNGTVNGGGCSRPVPATSQLSASIITKPFPEFTNNSVVPVTGVGVVFGGGPRPARGRRLNCRFVLAVGTFEVRRRAARHDLQNRIVDLAHTGVVELLGICES